MDQVEKFSGSSHTDSHSLCTGVTPPNCNSKLPPTPPATDERRQRSHRTTTRQDGIHMLREYKRKAEEGDSLPYAEFQVEPWDYRSESIERLVNRHDYNEKDGELFIRMPSTVHEYFSSRVVDIVKDQLRKLGEREDSEGRFASQVTSVGSARIFLRESDEADSKSLRRQPDAQFQHPSSIYPGVVIEVSYSQDGKNLRKLAEDYILFSGGDIKVVVGIDINPVGKESTISLWRPKFTWLDDEEIDSLEANPEVSQRQFRQSDGSPANEDERLTIRLSDFACDQMRKGLEATLLTIPFCDLPDILADAEQLQQKRESGQDKRPRRPLKRMRLPSSSPEQLRSEDEARFVDEEKAAAKQAEDGDLEFQGRSEKRRF